MVEETGAGRWRVGVFFLLRYASLEYGALMRCRGGVSLLMVFALVFGVLLVSCPAFAVQGGFSRPYTHYADDEDLTVILTNFARSQGLGASFSPGVVGKVSGRFDAVPPETFLKGMQAGAAVLIAETAVGMCRNIWREHNFLFTLMIPGIFIFCFLGKGSAALALLAGCILSLVQALYFLRRHKEDTEAVKEGREWEL